MSEKENCAENTDVTLFEKEDDGGMRGEVVVLTKDGKIGIKYYGMVVVKSVERWVKDSWIQPEPFCPLPEKEKEEPKSNLFEREVNIF